MEKATKTTVTKQVDKSGTEEHEHLEATKTEVHTERSEQPEPPEKKTTTVTTTTTVEND